MRFWWLSNCNCSAPLRAGACCKVRKSYLRPGLATSVRAYTRRSKAQKSQSEVVEQHERARSRVIKKFEGASFGPKFDAAEWQRKASKKD